MTESRYDRQLRIKGWDQDRLKNAKVVVISTEMLADDLLINLAGLGVGKIFLIGNQKIKKDKNIQEFLLFKGLPGQSKAEAIEDIIKEINPDTEVYSICMPITSKIVLESILPEYVDCIIDVGNHPKIERLVYEYAINKKINIINVGCSENYGELAVLNAKSDIRVFEDMLQGRIENAAQHHLTSSLIAGLASDELRKILMPLSNLEKILEEPIFVDYTNKKRIFDDYYALQKKSDEDVIDYSKIDFEKMKKQKVLVVGAGSLGNYVIKDLCLMGFEEIYLIDNDITEEVNLNRQIFLWDAVGKPKSEALAAKMKEIFGVKVIPIVGKFNEEFKLPDNSIPDIIFDCVDSYVARRMMNNYAKKHKIPLISGATDFDSGRVVVYVPGKTQCLDCLLDINKKAAEEEAVTSCIREPNASVIISNRIIAALMCLEAKALYAESPLEGVLKYDSNAPTRIFRTYSKKKCNCHEGV